MQKNRRSQTRRNVDQVLKQTVTILQILEKISKGEEVDYTEHFADLVGIKDRLGRRHEDKKLGALLCSSIEAIASNINTLLKEEKSLRKVRITKVSGRKAAQVRTHTSVEGWEAARPGAGENYRIYKDDGGVFSTSPVIEVKSDYFRTHNSLYTIEVIP